jgi:hypothetical protein
MNYLLKGITYSYNRNIGWLDRTVRSSVGAMAFVGSVYFMDSNLMAATGLALLFIAQLVTVLTAKCILCFFMGVCTITQREKRSLDERGISYERYHAIP